MVGSYDKSRASHTFVRTANGSFRNLPLRAAEPWATPLSLEFGANHRNSAKYRLPDAIVATQRRTSSKLVEFVLSRILSPISPLGSVGTPYRSKTWNRWTEDHECGE